MKRFAFLLSLFFILSTINITATDQINPWYYGYFYIKEMIAILGWNQFFFDEAVIQQVSVGCKKCNCKISFGETLGWTISKCLGSTVTRLKYLACHGSVDELNQLICKVHEEHEIVCPVCMQFHGWQILP